MDYRKIRSLIHCQCPVLHIDIPIRRAGLLDRDVEHRRIARRAVPVPDSSRDGDHVAGPDDTPLGLGRDDPTALDDLQDLVARVDVRPGTRAGAEVDSQQFDLATVIRTDQGLHMHLALEVIASRGILPGLRSIDGNDLHRSPSCLIWYFVSRFMFHADTKRRNTSYSRPRLVTSTHSSSECSPAPV